MFILIGKVKYYTKDVINALKIILLSVLFLISIIFIKYKPVYTVKLAGETLGYVAEKSELENEITKYTNTKTGTIALIDIKTMPEYEFELVSKDIETKEKDILELIEQTAVITYRTYGVTVNGELKVEVDTEDEAKEIIANLEQDLIKEIEFNLGYKEIYKSEQDSKSEDEALNLLTDIKLAKVNEYEEEQARLAAERAKAVAYQNSWATMATQSYGSYGIVNGVSIVNPLKSNVLITSRFGEVSSRRSSTHTGLDLATSLGTPIYPIAGGTVVFSGWQGSYGWLMIIDHGNGVESYYGHCNTLNVGVGEEVNSDMIIGTVGSTGNSSGPHLHLEIRVNGEICNPQNYLY